MNRAKGGRLVVVLRLLVFAVITTLSAAADDNKAAHALLDQGRVDDAVSLLENQVRSKPGDSQAQNLLCRVYLTVDQWDAAIAACEQAVKFAPDSSEYHLWLGRSYGSKAEHAGALSAGQLAGKVRNEFEIAVQLNPQSVEARGDLADFYLEAPWFLGGGKQKAELQAQEMAKVEPAQADLVRARIAEKEKNSGVAENNYRRAIEDSGGKAGTWMALARFYRRASRFDEMEHAIQRATAPELNRPDVLLSAADLLFKSDRNLAEAMELLQRYLSSPISMEDAPLFNAHYLLGTVLERQGRRKEAVEQYQAALSLARQFIPAQTALKRLSARAANQVTR